MDIQKVLGVSQPSTAKNEAPEIHKLETLNSDQEANEHQSMQLVPLESTERTTTSQQPNVNNCNKRYFDFRRNILRPHHHEYSAALRKRNGKSRGRRRDRRRSKARTGSIPIINHNTEELQHQIIVKLLSLNNDITKVAKHTLNLMQLTTAYLRKTHEETFGRLNNQLSSGLLGNNIIATQQNVRSPKVNMYENTQILDNVRQPYTFSDQMQPRLVSLDKFSSQFQMENYRDQNLFSDVSIEEVSTKKMHDTVMNDVPVFPENGLLRKLDFRTKILDSSSNIEQKPITMFSTNASNTSEESDLCGLCRATLKTNDQQIILPCSHKYHKNCIEYRFSIMKMCPICSAKVEFI